MQLPERLPMIANPPRKHMLRDVVNRLYQPGLLHRHGCITFCLFLLTRLQNVVDATRWRLNMLRLTSAEVIRSNADLRCILTPPDRVSLASTDIALDPSRRRWQHRLKGVGEPGIVKSPFASVKLNGAVREALLFDLDTGTEHVASLAEFLDGLRSSLGARIRDLISEHHGHKCGLGVDVTYRHMAEEPLAVGHLSTYRAVLPNDFPKERGSTDRGTRIYCAI